MIRIMLVDDQRFARLGFQLMLDDASDIVVTAQSADGRSAIETLEQVAVQHRPLPNVILMDVRMPGMDGIEATRRITRRWPTISILILTTYDEDDYAFGGLDAGASGFLLKRTPPEVLLDGIRTIAAGDGLLSPSVTRRLMLEFAKTTTQPGRPTDVTNRDLDRLTEREREVLIHLGHGLANREIALELNLGESTVKTHVKRILMKLALRDRVDAVVYAYETGLLAPRARND